MRGSHLLPKQLRSLGKSDSWLNRTITSNLLAVSHVACQHPIHTIVAIAFLASTSYVGLLQESLFDSGIKSLQHNGRVDVEALLTGSRTLELSQNTAWKWQFSDDSSVPEVSLGPNHYALTTFVFPDSSSAPEAHSIPIPANVTATNIPTTSNLLSPISHDASLAFYTTFSELPDFLRAAQELPAQNAPAETDEQASWIMKAARVGNGRATYATWFREGWTSFVDLLKHAETLDIIIMSLGYLSMHLTFISLFLSMKRLGSNAWLAVSVLFSSLFAFLFGLVTTTKLGVPINMVLLSEGLPFLVVTVGFEKSIILTKAVLSASYDTKRHPTENGSANGSASGPVIAPNAPNSIQDAIQIAIKETGFEIVRDYAIEIAILVAGAASGVQGGLRQFCFLAAWILFYDCVLLFTFYTTILCIKLEINRIKRHVALRKALEEDGINHRVAENVATNNDWPNGPSGQTGFNIFGQKIRPSSVPKFKIWMVGGFVLINVVNLCTIPFRTSTSIGAAIPSVLTPAPIDPFKVAENGLDAIYVSAKSRKLDTFVTVLPPIKYELDYPSLQQDVSQDELGWFDQEYTDQFLHVVGGRVIEGVLKSLEDPVLSKWVLIALTLSLILNGYLFNAARWSLKEPQSSANSPAGQKAPRLELPQTPRPKPLDFDLQAESGRSKEECAQMVKDKKAAYLTDEELIDLSLKGKIPGYAIEKTLENPEVMTRLDSFVRAVKVRRAVVSRTSGTRFAAGLEVSKAPYRDYNYELVHGACCENVIGYLPLPLGVAGPIVIDGQNYFLPMATTEGVLIASTSRGCKAINAGGGAVTIVTADGMTRGPCMSFPTVTRTGEAKIWLDSEEGQRRMREAFNSTSRFARLQSMKSAIAGTNLYVRFKTTTGDAMGMNMISKGVEKALSIMSTECGFDDMTIVSLSGNYCIDKKPSAINWIDGRGKAVVAEAIIPGDVVKNVLKSNVDDLVELNISKNLVGSAMAGSIGGNNAHAANIVAAMFLATGQDPAQVVESASCITLMKNTNGNLQISVSMPCLEVGTIGGGTILEAQSSMLDLLGVRGAHPTNPGDNARQLARIIAAGVLAGELSLCAALRAGHLVKAHMAHNRSAAPTRTSTPVSAAVEPFQKAQNGPNVPSSLKMTNGNGK
ncbi:3-hydroxy-3-methylglutaryl-coenzyme A (HMG-CoA) reductase isozyme [Exophiala xenobiotica]|nr:3-hydroxy-3-methylglutaryl-coenzyme A (HMG-CoA) reductase isozyme [Exophiala xenobiotica]KAK5228659.1 3-hydroxy-3-methylglutaryl-coenzyme A (HMG-CoA) reductase isozyme [Exophiala xenobiotica]KAK5238270.1 3-hydroxy-3-methylglutaryl-coenzyme A (HMG-CoA) reductase isozyme [Exophiala xenobiotica]KAK5246798.1 3-hydroxy-3-methylglutaryl-coenzyme A (HMG-CoA) reductase isozyme [Exophiala xenobiotica]KAK5301901.1 3-hydroxy-3-methylglutaryl-coenzyme A (HMG-CoA) reductase isozyme [Exophiala xenobiotica